MNRSADFLGPLAPGSMVGILGGGQLGRMLALAAARLGLKTHIYSDESESCAFYVTTETTRASFDDNRALTQFAAKCDVVTFEFENVPDETLRHIAQHTAVAPGPDALSIMQDRFSEKSFVTQLGLATPVFHNVESEADAASAINRLGSRAVLKTRKFGYDGKGQRIVATADEARRAFNELGRVPCVLEAFIDFAFEGSVVAVRGRDGSFAAYDVTRNEHENHILRRSTVPAPLSETAAADAITMARHIAEALNYVGVLGVEMFVTRDGNLLVNEIAPRVHNSGHWTLEACAVSQFEQHIRAIAGWPLGTSERHSDAVMQNILGQEIEQWRQMAPRSGLHIYGKRVARPGRKMGHITTLAARRNNRA